MEGKTVSQPSQRREPYSVTTHERIEDGEEQGAPLRTFVLVPDDGIVIRAAEVAREVTAYGVRGAAEVFCTSPSTISRFLRRNGYRMQWEAPDDRP